MHNQTPAQARAVGGIPRVFLYSKRPYLVELDGDLLIVVRDRLIDDPETYMYEPCSVDETIEESKIGYGVKEFQVFKVDLCNEMEWAKIKSLGDYALFVGDNASISLQASKFQELKLIASITPMIVGDRTYIVSEEEVRTWAFTTWKLEV